MNLMSPACSLMCLIVTLEGRHCVPISQTRRLWLRGESGCSLLVARVELGRKLCIPLGT